MAKAVKAAAPSRRRIDVRLDDALFEAINRQVEEKRHKNASAYLRSLVERDLRAAPDDDRIASLEKIISANHARLSAAVRTVAMTQRVEYAFVEAAVKAILSYLPDAGPEAKALVQARGKERYERVVRAAEQSGLELLNNLAKTDREK